MPVPPKVCEPLANSPSNLAANDHVGVKKYCAPADASAESFGGVAPLTTKLEPGSDWKTASSDGLLTQSWAQAKRARKINGIPFSNVGSSKRAPSSLRVSFAVMAL